MIDRDKYPKGTKRKWDVGKEVLKEVPAEDENKEEKRLETLRDVKDDALTNQGEEDDDTVQRGAEEQGSIATGPGRIVAEKGGSRE